MLTHTFKTNFTIESYMVDFRNKLKLSVLLSLDQETALKHVAEIFVRYGNPADNGGFWIITQAWTSIDRLPEFKEVIEVETWIRSVSWVVTRRNFRVSDAAGKVIARTSIDYAVLDASKRFPRRLDKWLDKAMQRDDQGSLIEDRVMRKAPQLTPAYLKTVRYADIDVNNHANNTRYIDWMMDSFDLDYLNRKEVTQLHVAFKKECVASDRLNIFQGTYQNDDFYLEGRFADSDTAAFMAEIAFV
ncbi:MAG: thioesterase [Peptococcaceae bacterium]|nr:thioesterase [Peptococcaceae bacterium]